MNRDVTGPTRETIPYEEALALQQSLIQRRVAGEIDDLLWLLEHPPTITWGSAGRGAESNNECEDEVGPSGHLLLSEREYARRGIRVYQTNRGGDVTCHEPGQLVVYPMLQLREGPERDLHLYLRTLECALIDVLQSLGLRTVRVADRTGVWVEGDPARKVAAIGVRATKWVTSHGAALNVYNSLEGFSTIVPCGISDAEVTSLEREIGRESVPEWDALCARVHSAMESAFDRPLRLVLGSAARGL